MVFHWIFFYVCSVPVNAVCQTVTVTFSFSPELHLNTNSLTHTHTHTLRERETHTSSPAVVMVVIGIQCPVTPRGSFISQSGTNAELQSSAVFWAFTRGLLQGGLKHTNIFQLRGGLATTCPGCEFECVCV